MRLHWKCECIFLAAVPHRVFQALLTQLALIFISFDVGFSLFSLYVAVVCVFFCHFPPLSRAMFAYFSQCVFKYYFSFGADCPPPSIDVQCAVWQCTSALWQCQCIVCAYNFPLFVYSISEFFIWTVCSLFECDICCCCCNMRYPFSSFSSHSTGFKLKRSFFSVGGFPPFFSLSLSGVSVSEFERE